MFNPSRLNSPRVGRESMYPGNWRSDSLVPERCVDCTGARATANDAE